MLVEATVVKTDEVTFELKKMVELVTLVSSDVLVCRTVDVAYTVDSVTLVDVRSIVWVRVILNEMFGDMYTATEAVPTMASMPTARMPTREEIPTLRYPLAADLTGLALSSGPQCDFKLSYSTS